MTYRYKIFEDTKLVYVKADGTMRFQDLMEHIETLAKDPGYTSPMKKLLNYLELEKYEVTTRESEIFSKRKQELVNRFMNEKCAIVVPSDLIYGMARHHQAFVDPVRLETDIFRDINEAIRWLEIDPDQDFTL